MAHREHLTMMPSPVAPFGAGFPKAKDHPFPE